jgi:hypothetical protein
VAGSGHLRTRIPRLPLIDRLFRGHSGILAQPHRVATG